MTWKELLENLSMQLVLIFWFASTFLVMFLLGQLDWIVHNTLYNYNLTFSLDWAVPYWTILRLIYVWLIAPSVLGAIVLGLDFWKRRSSTSKSEGGMAQQFKGGSMVITCNHCGKVFSKPICMLDFSSGKPKLVNVCPYCNAKLGDINENKDEEDLEAGVLSPDERVRTEQ